MNNYEEEAFFDDYDATPAAGPERFGNEYRTFEFEAMTEVPTALAAYVSHQHCFDL